METVRTVVCKLNPTPEQRTELDATLVAFADACHHIADVARAIHSTNKVKVQHACYQAVRERFGLSANLVIRAIARVCTALKVRARAHAAFDPTSIDYDQRIFSFREWDWTFSLTLLHSRQRIETVLGARQASLLKGRIPTSATLVKRRDGRFFLHVQVKDEVPEPGQATRAIGVDLGRTDIAYTSTGQHWSGQDITRVRDHYSRLRMHLQRKASKGTRSTRRRCRNLLARLSGHERRFQRHTNHVISKAIVTEARDTNATVVLEDLRGIRERTNRQRRTRTERRRGNSWAFYQLRQFIVYKAQGASVPVVLYPPAYTSQMCHGCYHLGSRSGKRFACHYCGWTGDADYNAAKNLEILGLQVSLPRGPWVHSVWSGEPNGLLESCLRELAVTDHEKDTE